MNLFIITKTEVSGCFNLWKNRKNKLCSPYHIVCLETKITKKFYWSKFFVTKITSVIRFFYLIETKKKYDCSDIKERRKF